MELLCEQGVPIGRSACVQEFLAGNGKHSGGIPIMRLHHKDGLNTDRTGKLVKCEDNRVMQVHDRTRKPVESSTHTHSARIWFSRTS